MTQENKKAAGQHLPINQETLDIIVANVIPTSKYFEVRFDHLEKRVDQMQDGIVLVQEDIKGFRTDVDSRFINLNDQLESRFNAFRNDIDNRFTDFKHDSDNRFNDFKIDVDKRFEQVDKRFEQVDKRFEQVDKRFEQVDKRFEKVDKRFDQVDKRFEQMINSIDRLSDNLNHRDEEHRSFTMRLFSISIMISFLGVLGVFLKLFQVI